MSYLTLHKTKLLLSVISVLVGLGFNVSLHEVGLEWHYPVISLLCVSLLSVIGYGITWRIVQRSTLHTRPRASSRNTYTPTPATNIQVNTWKWEFPGGDSASASDVSNANSFSAPASLPIITKTQRENQLNLKEKQKYFLAAGLLMAGGGICSVFTSQKISYQWQVFVYQFILPFTHFISEYTLTKTRSKQLQGGLIIIAFGGFLNGIPLVLETSFNGWCGMFGASSIFYAATNVYIGYLHSKQFHPVEIAAWSNVYLLCVVVLVAPLYALTGLQDDTHSFAKFFWYQKQGVQCLTTGSSVCHPYGWAYGLSFIVLCSLYFILQALLTCSEDPSMQAGINSLALPGVVIVYQVMQSVNIKIIYPILSIVVIIVGIVVCKIRTLAREYEQMKPYRF